MDNAVIASEPLGLRGRVQAEHWRDGVLIGTYDVPNGIVNQGKNRLLDNMFNSGTAITEWFLGLIDNAGFSALAATDTYQGIDAANGWDEFADYTDANNGDSATTRPEWAADAASSQSISNGTVAIFDITGSGTVKGVFLVGGIVAADTKGNNDASGVLWATALFGVGDVVVSNGDQLKVTYTVNA